MATKQAQAPTRKLSTLAIGAKIKAGKDFWVGTNLERKAAIAAAGFMGVKITTQKQVLQPGGFNVYFLDK